MRAPAWQRAWASRGSDASSGDTGLGVATHAAGTGETLGRAAASLLGTAICSVWRSGLLQDLQHTVHLRKPFILFAESLDRPPKKPQKPQIP
jgi:hypothetical protein